jgi:hypothetical protein
MFDAILIPAQQDLHKEVRTFVPSAPRQLFLDMVGASPGTLLPNRPAQPLIGAAQHG